jgi:hypothetical protein
MFSKHSENPELDILSILANMVPIYGRADLGHSTLNNMIWAKKKIYVCHAPLPLQKFVSTLAQSLWKLESYNFGSCVVFWANLMYLIIFKFRFLRVTT